MTRHIANQARTPAVERAAEQEQIDAQQYVGRRVEWDPKDDHGIRRGIVVGWSRYDEGNRIGGLLLRARRDEGDRKGTEFSFPFQNEDSWRVIDDKVDALRKAGKALADWIVDHTEDPSVEPVKSLLDVWDRAV